MSVFKAYSRREVQDLVLPNPYYAGVWAVEEIFCVEPMVPPRHLEAAKGDGSVNAQPAASVSVEEKSG
jgi:hypothetical protein